MYHHPKLGWVELDKAEVKSIGMELYINQLHFLGFDLAKSESMRPKKLIDILRDFPFESNDLKIYTSLLSDGWKRVQMSRAEDLGCRFFLNLNAGMVSPLFKTFGNAKCIFDSDGFSWYFGSKKIVYGSPLQF